MLKKTITYVDYNDEERTEDHYFNITKAELAMMEASKIGGLRQYLEKIVQEKDTVSIMETFKTIIHQAYGKKSDDGRRFIKSDEISTEFEQTEAYSELIMELLGDAEKASRFINGILPKDIVSSVENAKGLPSK